MFEDIKIESGEFVLICGKSGSGKTTFLRELLQRYKTEGVCAGYVMQNFDAQIVTDKVWYELCFGLENKGVDRKTMHRRVAEVCSYFGITDWLDRDTAMLSGGQKQLLNLASVMVLTPSVLLLDEPVSQLDPVAAGNFLNTVRKLNDELGITVVIAEHRIEELFDCASRILFFSEMKAVEYKKDNSGVIDIEEIKSFLPVPARIALETGLSVNKNSLPFSVKDGRNFLKSCVRDRRGSEAVNQGTLRWPELSLINGAEAEPRIARPDALVKIKDLCFCYDKHGPEILSELNLDIFAGEIFAVVGANGSGKSTLLKLIAGLKKPVSGKIVKNKNVRIFLLPQNVRNIFTRDSVREELKSAGWDEQKPLQIVNFDLDVHPYDISGGEMQKLALEMILLQQPDIILLDEPTKALDNVFKKEFSDILKNLAACGKAVFIVCHDLEFCAVTAGRVAIMFEGQLSGLGTPGEFFGGNNFYTTAANRMSRGIVDGPVTEQNLVEFLK